MQNIKKLIILVTIVYSLAYVNCGTQPIVGGLGEEKPADDHIRQVVKDSHNQLEEVLLRKLSSLEPITYRKQVVAGWTYYVKALAKPVDGPPMYLHVRIYEGIHKPVELLGIRRDVGAETPLKFFD